MNKNQAELINYAIMPGHVMENVSIIYVSCLIRKMPELPLGSAGFNCFEASRKESPLVNIASRNSLLTFMEDFNKGLSVNATGKIREHLN